MLGLQRLCIPLHWGKMDVQILFLNAVHIIQVITIFVRDNAQDSGMDNITLCLKLGFASKLRVKPVCVKPVTRAFVPFTDLSGRPVSRLLRPDCGRSDTLSAPHCRLHKYQDCSSQLASPCRDSGLQTPAPVKQRKGKRPRSARPRRAEDAAFSNLLPKKLA